MNKNRKLICPLILIIMANFIFARTGPNANAQSQYKNIRPAARAGQFYPGNRSLLTENIQDLLRSAQSTEIDGDIIGLMVPHAGYEWSGSVAVNGYILVRNKPYDVVVIVGPSHYTGLRGASIGMWDGYRTPLGVARVDTLLARQLRDASDLITSVPAAHRYEHSVEVQVPFIQTVLPGVPIVPMVIRGDLDYDKSSKIAKVLAETLAGLRVLLIASTDMSHFPNYQDAYDVDLRVLDAVGEYDSKEVMDLSRSLIRRDIPGLDCALCGPSALVTVMLATRRLQAEQVHILPYANSGDVSGERNRVVGYGAAVFYAVDLFDINLGEENMPEEIPFSDAEVRALFRIARESISHAINRQTVPDFKVDEDNLKVPRGVFVTLENQGQLRGCIGHFDADYPLYQITSQMAVAAATQDYRFAYNPVSISEMDNINIKISILSTLRKIDTIDDIEVGKHGIWIKQHGRGGTYLPEVATQMGWSKVEFLEHCCQEKAGLSKDAWKEGADIFIYSSQILSEKDY